MRDATALYGPWVLSLWSMTTMYLAGCGTRTRRLAWVSGILSQVAWISFSVVTEQHGFAVSSLVYAAIYARNLRRTSAELRAAR